MGYTIRIGEAIVVDMDGRLEASVGRIEIQSAPAANGDCELNHHSNERWPSYSGWRDFVVKAGLFELFYEDDEGLMRSHPGCFRLMHEHVEEIEHALSAFREKHPDAVPRFGVDVSTGPNDPTLARLEWLAWWARWAVDNCKMPAIANT